MFDIDDMYVRLVYVRQTKQGEQMESKQYYVKIKDGYSIGDIYIHAGDDKIKYEVIEIEPFNQLMLVEEIENNYEQGE